MVDRIVRLIKEYGSVFLAVIIIVTPIVWKVASSYFNERLETLAAHATLLQAQVAVLKEQKVALEDKLRQPLELAEATKSGNEKSLAQPPPSESDRSIKKILRLPQVADFAKPTKYEVRELARFYDLFRRWKVNPHLRFKEGDISYWSEEGLTEKELMNEFESRQTVLRRAEESGEKIPSKGDLSYKAEQLQAISQRP